VLNAKQHERESRVVAQAGRKGAVTVATTWPGRGTDILLGGNPEQMTRDHFLKNKLAMPYAAAPAVIGADPADGNGARPTVPMVLFQNEGKIFQVPADQWNGRHCGHAGDGPFGALAREAGHHMPRALSDRFRLRRRATQSHLRARDRNRADVARRHGIAASWHSGPKAVRLSGHRRLPLALEPATIRLEDFAFVLEEHHRNRGPSAVAIRRIRADHRGAAA